MTAARTNLMLAAVLAGAMILSSLLGSFILDQFTNRRPDGGSITTHFPGFVYANVAMMKVSIVEVLVLAVAGTFFWTAVRRNDNRPVRFCSAASILIQPAAMFMSTVVVVTSTLICRHETALDSSHISRIGVFFLIGIVVFGLLLSGVAIDRNERPVTVPLIGAATNIALLFLFYYFEFYKLGFDQDNWAN